MWLIIGVSGATCSGKSTLARSLHEALPGSSLICQDDFFLPVDSERHTLIPALNHFNWEIMSSLDMEKMHTTIENLLSSDCDKTVLSFSNLVKAVSKATGSCLNAEIESDKIGTVLNFTDTSYRKTLDDVENPKSDQPLSVATNQTATSDVSRINLASDYGNMKTASGIYILIIEGFLIFNDKKLAGLCNLKYFLTLTREQCWARRSSRTYDPADVPGYFDQCVWPEYEKHRDQVFKEVPNVILIDGTLDRTSVLKQVLMEVVEVIRQLHSMPKYEIT